MLREPASGCFAAIQPIRFHVVEYPVSAYRTEWLRTIFDKRLHLAAKQVSFHSGTLRVSFSLLVSTYVTEMMYVKETFYAEIAPRGIIGSNYHRPSRDWTNEEPKNAEEEDPVVSKISDGKFTLRRGSSS